MKIGELSARTGVSTRLLRYYEEMDLLHPYRHSNGYRGYGEPAIERVLQIRELIDAGLTTEMIRNVLPCLVSDRQEDSSDQCPSRMDLDALRRQLAGIERRIEVLQMNRQAIKRYLAACERSDVEVSVIARATT